MPEFENRIVFVEDYDTYVGRRLVSGRRSLAEQSAAPVGSQRHERHEAASERRAQPQRARWLVVRSLQRNKNGWAIGAEIPESTTAMDPPLKMKWTWRACFASLETQIIPLYYAKPDGRLPLAWMQLMRESIRSVRPVFNTHRMVKEYAERLYEPAARAHKHAWRGRAARKPSSFRAWKDDIRKAWPQIRIAESK